MKPKRILLISGSHRRKKTTSNSILDYIEKKLLTLDFHVMREQVSANVPDIHLVSHIIMHLQNCNTIIFCFPLYFDALPYPLLSMLELMHANKENNAGINMFSIVHCGLPEFNHCENVLSICRQFAEHMGFCLIGEAIIPDTGAVDGEQIDRIKRIKSVLDKIINILILGKNENQIKRIIVKPSMHPIVFRIIGNIIMKHFVKKNKADIFQKVYGD